MFSSTELSTLISGAEHEISVTDLQAHTNYSGGYEVNHPTITAFWQVVSGFDEDQKRSLLKFVTSCSRPPLLGFKVSFICCIHNCSYNDQFQDLDPPFCIQNAGTEQERLPTASTCMNLLKLPDFRVRRIFTHHIARDTLTGVNILMKRLFFVFVNQNNLLYCNENISEHLIIFLSRMLW